MATKLPGAMATKGSVASMPSSDSDTGTVGWVEPLVVWVEALVVWVEALVVWVEPLVV